MKKTKRSDQISRLLAVSEAIEIDAPKPSTPAGSKPAAKSQAAKPIEGPKIGRPPGKRSNPDYQSVTTFLHKQTYQDVQRALYGTGRDFGDVVDELLAGWLKARR